MKYRELLREPRIIFLLAMILVGSILVANFGLHFGLEFEGGVRIPISLEKPVNQLVMSDVINTIKVRATKYGMSQVIVKGIGSSEIYVEVPKGDAAQLEDIEKLLKEQGRFEGIVNGRLAVSGEDMMPGSIKESQPTLQGNDVRWAVSFAITQEAARKFATVVYGKAEYPVYMFLDRPEDAIVVVKRSDLLYGNLSVGETEAIRLLEKAGTKENDSLKIFIEDDFASGNQTIASLNSTKRIAIVSQEAAPSLVSALQNMNYEVVNKTLDEMRPSLYMSTDGTLKVNEWGAINLLSAPVLSKDITEGRINQFYEVNGFAPRNLPTYEKKSEAALAESKKLKSILSGGALPVKIIIGTPTTIPASLGHDFLYYSAIGALLSALVISSLIFLRYREPRIVLPIIATILLEMILTLSLVGTILGTIDLGVMAGVIGATGTGVNDQIVITDEILRGKEEDEERGVKVGLGRAFFIVIVGALVAIIALVPLLFSGLVEIVGFALSGIIEMIMSTAVTRPAFGKFMEKLFEK
jgi:preprotein translocase subunit SecD